MNRIGRKGLRYALVGVAAGASMLASPAWAHAAPDTWGQEVKQCDQSACYPGGSSRGSYVRVQARDDSGQGYGREIQDLANPGKAAPAPFR